MLKWLLVIAALVFLFGIFAFFILLPLAILAIGIAVFFFLLGFLYRTAKHAFKAGAGIKSKKRKARRR